MHPREHASLLLTVLLAGLAMIGPFAIDTVFPAFQAIGREFAADEAAMQQVTSTYLLAFAVMSVFHGPLSDALGRKPVIIAGLLGFAAASVGAALAPNLAVLVACRAVQGAFAGGATVVSRVIIRDMFHGPEAHRLMSQVIMIFSIAPAVAPVAGGLLLGIGPWPVIFWAIAGYGVLMAVLTYVAIPETHPPHARQPMQVRPLLRSLWEVGKEPALLRLAGAIAMAFAAQFVYVVGAPIIVVDLLGLGERDFWVLFVPMIAGVAIGAWLSGRLAHRLRRRAIIDLSMSVLLASAAANIVLVLAAPRLPFAVVGVFLIAFAIAIAFPVLQLEILDLFPTHRGTAASVGTFASLVFNAVLAGLIVALVTATLLSTALAAAGFAVLAVLLWLWHRRATEETVV